MTRMSLSEYKRFNSDRDIWSLIHDSIINHQSILCLFEKTIIKLALSQGNLLYLYYCPNYFNSSTVLGDIEPYLVLAFSSAILLINWCLLSRNDSSIIKLQCLSTSGYISILDCHDYLLI